MGGGQVTTEAQRRAILADIIDPIWGSAPDHEIADAHGVSPRAVRNLRAEHRRDLGIAAVTNQLEELAELTAWPGSPGELLAACVEAALMRAQAREHRTGYGSALAEHRARVDAQREAEMAAGVDKILDCGRSADRVASRSQARAEASEGVSGRKGPDTTATARSREAVAYLGHGNVSGARVPG